MGLRGKLAEIHTPIAASTATEPPAWLGTDARKFWRKHRPHVLEMGLLTLATEDSFARLADVAGRLDAMRDQPANTAYFKLLSSYHLLAKLFRLLPTEQPKEQADRHEKVEFTHED